MENSEYVYYIQFDCAGTVRSLVFKTKESARKFIESLDTRDHLYKYFTADKGSVSVYRVVVHEEVDMHDSYKSKELIMQYEFERGKPLYCVYRQG